MSVPCRVPRLGQRGERPNQQHFSKDSARPQRHLKPRPLMPPDWWKTESQPPCSALPSFLDLISHSFAQNFAEVTFNVLLYFPPTAWPLLKPSSSSFSSSSLSDGATSSSVTGQQRGSCYKGQFNSDSQPFPRKPLMKTNLTLGVLS